MELVDTHCHLHEAVRRTTLVYQKWHEKGDVDPEEILENASAADVKKLICVGTTLEDSKLSVEFAEGHENVYASIGIHPHEASDHQTEKLQFSSLLEVRPPEIPEIVGVGECGLDYFYNHSPREAQIEMFKFQIELALNHDLPLIFHVREAFDDFWPIFDSFSEKQKIRGVLHSFTDSLENLERAINHGLFIGVNGIATFSNNPELYKSIPLDNLLLETDAPFLAPVPFRGQVNEPKFVKTIAEFLAGLRSESLENLAEQTTKNARMLFKI